MGTSPAIDGRLHRNRLSFHRVIQQYPLPGFATDQSNERLATRRKRRRSAIRQRLDAAGEERRKLTMTSTDRRPRKGFGRAEQATGSATFRSKIRNPDHVHFGRAARAGRDGSPTTPAARPIQFPPANSDSDQLGESEGGRVGKVNDPATNTRWPCSPS